MSPYHISYLNQMDFKFNLPQAIHPHSYTVVSIYVHLSDFNQLYSTTEYMLAKHGYSLLSSASFCCLVHSSRTCLDQKSVSAIMQALHIVNIVVV